MFGMRGRRPRAEVLNRRRERGRGHGGHALGYSLWVELLVLQRRRQAGIAARVLEGWWVWRSALELRPTIDGTLKARIWPLLRCLRSRGWWPRILPRRTPQALLTRSFCRYDRLCLVDWGVERRRAVAHIAILHALLQLWVLQLAEVERGRGGRLHECHRRVDGGVESFILTTWEGWDVVEPSWHTHVDSTLDRPICASVQPLASILASRRFIE